MEAVAVVDTSDDDSDGVAVPASPEGEEEGSRVIYAGWMYKKGRKVMNWKRRYFVLKPGGLMYWARKGVEDEEPPLGTINITGSTVEAVEAKGRAFPMRINGHGTSKELSLVLDTETQQLREEWMKQLEAAQGGALVKQGTLKKRSKWKKVGACHVVALLLSGALTQLARSVAGMEVSIRDAGHVGDPRVYQARWRPPSKGNGLVVWVVGPCTVYSAMAVWGA